MTCNLACEICASLRAAALEIIAEDGVEAITTDRLADHAGISRDEIRYHYSDASQCLYETYEEVSGSIHGDFIRSFAAVPGWRRGLIIGGRTLLERMAARPAEARLCFVEILRGDHELLRRRDAARRRLVDLFVRELGRRLDDPEQYRMQLEMLIGAVFQAIATAVATGDMVALPALEPEIVSRAFVFATVPA